MYGRMGKIIHVEFLLVTFSLLGLQEGCCQHAALDPFTPHIIGLDKDSAAQTLVVKWNLTSAILEDEFNITFEIQVGRTENRAVIQTSNVSVIHKTNETVFMWKWWSELPLECTDHSMRIRSFLNNTWSSWSPWKTVLGNKAKEKPQLYPIVKAFKIGSTAYICCIPSQGATVTEIKYRKTALPLININNKTKAIKMDNLKSSHCKGDFQDCKDSAGHRRLNSVYVFDPPEEPQNVNCETRDLWTVNCNLGMLLDKCENSFIQGYFPKKKCVSSFCGFDVIPGQLVYNITVTIALENKQADATGSLTMDITKKVFPVSPTILSKTSTPRSVNISWTLKGNFSSIRLICQIITNNLRNPMNYTFEGKSTGVYHGLIDGLHPYTLYNASVRCAAAQHFWKWSEWSSPIHFTTKPDWGPDLWRQISPVAEGQNIILLWKYNFESSGPISYYKVTWEGQQTEVSANETQTEITIGNGTCLINVTAVDSVGSSPPSQIIIPSVSGRDESSIEPQRIHGSREGFIVEWQQKEWVTCGYTVQWCEVLGSPCSVLQWRKFPVENTSAFITSGNFRPGQRYTFSVYGCKSDGDWLLERKTGYSTELAPKLRPDVTQGEVTYSSVTLVWTFPENRENHTGFIQGYLITVQNTDKAELFNISIDDSSTKTFTIHGLEAENHYNFSVAAFSVAGIGPPGSTLVNTRKTLAYYIIILLASILIPVLLVVLLIRLTWPNRKLLKDLMMDFFGVPVRMDIKSLKLDHSLFEASRKTQAEEMKEPPFSKLEILDPKQESVLLMSASVYSSSENLYRSIPHLVRSHCSQSSHTDCNNQETDFSNLTYISEAPVKEDHSHCTFPASSETQMADPRCQTNPLIHNMDYIASDGITL
ncbi:leukemia inhibitory factor receptor isoform X2 [Amia ocellicauda]|uniref:leukemia inhibitory factor receptor isoform X2 n=1 Tax=Amia ocellicauda TaxID=2972642 RepID=UPI003463A749